MLIMVEMMEGSPIQKLKMCDLIISASNLKKQTTIDIDFVYVWTLYE